MTAPCNPVGNLVAEIPELVDGMHQGHRTLVVAERPHRPVTAEKRIPEAVRMWKQPGGGINAAGVASAPGQGGKVEIEEGDGAFFGNREIIEREIAVADAPIEGG